MHFLGTGLGFALVAEHVVVTLKLGQLRHGKKTFSEILRRRALEKEARKSSRQQIKEVVPRLQRAFIADYITLGGGNAKHLKEPLPSNVRLGHNLTAFRGGFRLWGIDDAQMHEPDWPPAQPKYAEWRLL